MAYAYPNQSTINVVGPQFVDIRTVVPQVGFYPRFFGVANPSSGPVVPQVEFIVPFNSPVVAPFGFTVNPALLIRMDEERTQKLLQFMENEGLVPSPEEEIKRNDAIVKLKQIMLTWIKKVAWQRRLPKNQIGNSCATILTYGSYGLGVYGPESDIDALCVGPSFATLAEDFFIVLRNMLQNRLEVSELHCVKDAKVPLMRFKFNGISVDLPYAQLKVMSVPENVDILNPFFLRHIDETSWKSLSGVRANKCILRLVPNLKSFQSMLRCLKLWARRRGVYGNLLGFLGGVHIAILAAYVCQRHPTASINTLISRFFETFASWNWPKPVMLQDDIMPVTKEFTDMRLFMPIRLPCSPFEFCHSNITRSTSQRIRTEFLRGHVMTRDPLRPNFEWSSVFDPFPYTKQYRRFVRILLSASDQEELGDWVGWVKSRFRFLLPKIEDVEGFCDPNPTEYVDSNIVEPNIVFYWGLPGQGSFIDIDSIDEDFSKNINNGYQGPRGRIELSIVEASELPKNAQLDSASGKGSKAFWRILDYSQYRKPVYSRHLPYHLVGYVANNGTNEYPSAGG